MCSEKCSPQQPACDSLDETQAPLEAAARVTWRFGTRAAWVTVVPQSERVIDSCHLLHELAELPAAWVAVTHVLGRCDHGADALPICVLRRAVDLPALLWAGVQSLQNQRESQIVSFKEQVQKLDVCVVCCLSLLPPSRMCSSRDGRHNRRHHVPKHF